MPSIRVPYLLQSVGFLLVGIFFFGGVAAQNSDRTEAPPAVQNFAIDQQALSQLRSPDVSVRFPQDLSTPDRKAMEIRDSEGRVLRQSVSPLSDRISLNAVDTDTLIARPRELVTLDLTSRRAALPGGLIEPDRRESAASGETVWFRPTASASPIPAVWDPQQEQYLTHLLLGLQSSASESRQQPKHPVVMRLAFRGMDAEPVEPVALKKVGVEHDQRIRLAFRLTTARPVVELRTDLGSYDLRLEVVPRLEVRPGADSMNGLGLETMGVTVVRYGPDGGEFPVSAPTEVFVETSGIRKTTERVVIPEGQAHAVFRIRSSGLGAAQIRASAAGLEGVDSVQQQFPYLPVSASLLGGAIGGLCRRFRRKGADSRDLTRVLEGVLVALVGYAISVLGILQLGVPPAIAATEAGAFVTGVITGFLGVSVIEKLTGRLAAAR
ncbi:MAG: hypothetical protein SVX28_00715 [Pseudomonadota bacterium]|nr:hypothetical protein [Pseudomonadota bacterium]